MLRQQIITPAPYEPISLEYAKKALKQDPNSTVEDDLLAVFIAAANQVASSYTGIIPIYTKLAHYFEEWANIIILYQANPVLSVEKVEYMAEGSTAYTELDNSLYALDKFASPSRIKFLKPESLPAINTDHPEAIKITFYSGYLDGTGKSEEELQNAVPEVYRQAVALMAAHWYLFRADYAKKDAPSAAMSLLNTIKVSWI